PKYLPNGGAFVFPCGRKGVSLPFVFGFNPCCVSPSESSPLPLGNGKYTDWKVNQIHFHFWTFRDLKKEIEHIWAARKETSLRPLVSVSFFNAWLKQ
ncbi:unnamed protein product, partial [Urochloa humidicola]